MGYKAEDEVAKLDYDFAPFCPEIKGITPEPSPELIKQYWLSYQAGLRHDRNDLIEWQKRLEKIPVDDNAGRIAVEEEYAEFQDRQTDQRQDRRRKMLAMVCQNEPSAEELKQLPGRVYDDFERYMQDEISPKESRNGSN